MHSVRWSALSNHRLTPPSTPNVETQDVTDFKKIFSNEEQLLFEAGAAASASYMQWKAGNHGKIVASEAVASHVAKRARVG